MSTRVVAEKSAATFITSTGRTEAAKVGFIHVPKTAGSSLNTIIKSLNSDSFRLVSVHDFANFPDLLATIRFLSGHVPYFMYKWEAVERRLATVLRDPIDRVISNFRYILATPGHYAHDWLKMTRASLADCYRHPVMQIEFTNFQTKLLGWAPSREIVWPAHGRDKYRIFSKEYANFLYGTSNLSVLEQAADRLGTEIDFALSSDRESLISLCSRIGGSPVSDLPKENVTPPVAYVITPTDLEAIRQHNRLDAELFCYARELLRNGRGSRHGAFPSSEDFSSLRHQVSNFPPPTLAAD